MHDMGEHSRAAIEGGPPLTVGAAEPVSGGQRPPGAATVNAPESRRSRRAPRQDLATPRP